MSTLHHSTYGVRKLGDETFLFVIENILANAIPVDGALQERSCSCSRCSISSRDEPFSVGEPFRYEKNEGTSQRSSSHQAKYVHCDKPEESSCGKWFSQLLVIEV